MSSNIVSEVRTAADAAFTLLIPLLAPGNSAERKGSRLKQVRVFYKIGAADADDFATVNRSR